MTFYSNRKNKSLPRGGQFQRNKILGVAGAGDTGNWAKINVFTWWAKWPHNFVPSLNPKEGWAVRPMKNAGAMPAFVSSGTDFSL